MFTKIKNIILAHLALSAVAALVVIIGIGGASYFAFQKGTSSDNTKEKTSDSSAKSCSEIVRIGETVVEKDPAGDPEAWIRFDYTMTGGQSRNCQYAITFYDSQEGVIRTIPVVESTFESPSGQIHNGYSSTPYQAGMTARVTVQ